MSIFILVTPVDKKSGKAWIERAPVKLHPGEKQVRLVSVRPVMVGGGGVPKKCTGVVVCWKEVQWGEGSPRAVQWRGTTKATLA